MKRRLTILTLGALLLAGNALAGAPAASLLEVEREVLGADASSLFRAQDIGGDVGGSSISVDRGPSNLGTKLKAGALSLLLPGLGQLYNGDRGKAMAFGGAEVAVWTTYGVLHTIARGAEEDYQDYAAIYAGVASSDHTERYWRAVGREMTSDDYNNDIRMEARSEGVEPTGLIAAADAWFWRNETRQNDFQLLRADATRAYDRRDFTVLFAIINRAISAYDAVRSAGDGDHMIELGALGVDLEPRRLGGKAGTACVASLSF